jgi:outer membrane protein assembly factor BamB
MKKFVLIVLVVSLSTLTLTATGDDTIDWCRWRGPYGNGTSDETGWNPLKLMPEPEVVWKANVGFGYSSLCIKGKYLYTMGNKDKKDTVYCLSVDDGKKVWDYTYPYKPGNYAGPRATPVYSDNCIYTVSRDGQVFCFEAATGRVKWQKDLKKDVKAKIPRWGMASSALIEGELLLLNVCQYGLALNKKTGKVVWQSPPTLCGYASPVLYDAGDQRCMVAFGQKAAYGVNVETGKQLWARPWETRSDQNTADPVVSENQVFISSIYSKGCMLFDMIDNRPVDIWQNETLSNKFSSSILYKGHLYGVHGNTISTRGNEWDRGRQKGALACVDFKTGKLLWEYGVGIASLIIVDGKLIVLNEKGLLLIAEATPSGYREIAKAQVLKRGNTFREAKGKCWTAPILCRGMIYCRNDLGQIVCINVN